MWQLKKGYQGLWGVLGKPFGGLAPITPWESLGHCFEHTGASKPIPRPWQKAKCLANLVACRECVRNQQGTCKEHARDMQALGVLGGCWGSVGDALGALGLLGVYLGCVGNIG